MQRFPLFIDDIQKWIVETVRLQDKNVLEFQALNRKFPQQGVQTLTWSATIAIDTRVNPLNAYYNGAMNADATINASNVGNSGRIINFVLKSDGTARTVTFGTGFSPTATLVGTISQTRTISFVEVNGTLWEIARTAAR